MGWTEPLSEHWSSFWAEANLTSFRDSFSSNYDAQIADFWRSQFAELQTGSRILDLCTGNGAIAILAAQYSLEHKQDFTVVATDAAEIHCDALQERFPDLSKALSTIEFIDETRIEDLVLPANSFDLISSQFGIEYTDVASSAPQIATLLRAEGRFVALSHCPQSAVMDSMHDDELDYALEHELGILAALGAYVEGKQSFIELRSTLRRASERLVAECKTQEAPLRVYLRDSLSNMLASPEPLFRVQKPRLRGFIQNLEHGRSRLKDLLRVRDMMKANPNWQLPFSETGLVLTRSEDLYLEDDSEPIGHVYIFRKNLKD